MRKLMLLALFVFCTAPAAFAQTTTTDFDKVNVFAGFSHNRVDTGVNNNEDPELDDIIDEREGFNGFNASVTGNVSRYVGLKFDYSYHQRNFDFGGGFETKARLHNFLGGVQFKDNSKDETKRAKPFAHIMAGAARSAIDLSDLDDDFEDFHETGFAAAVGGGLDVRINDRFDFRAFQLDYNPTRFEGETQHNFRVGIGIVIK